MDEKAQLAERQKELNCIYRIDKLIAEENDIHIVLTATCRIIADSMQYPCHTSVLIEYAGNSIKSPYYRPSKNLIEALIMEGEEYGKISVYYSDEMNNTQNVFLKEEHMLLNAVAKRITTYLSLQKFQSDNSIEKSQRINKFAAVRLEIVQNAVSSADFYELGIYRVYLIGSVKNFSSAISSDIDIIIHFDGSPESQIKTQIWFKSWSSAVLKSNEYKYEFSEMNMIFDLHFITNMDIEQKSSYAVMISSHHNSARLIKSILE